MANTSSSISGSVKVRPPAIRRLRFFSYLLPCAVLGLALAAAWYFWERERREIEQALQVEFDARVRETTSLFRERMLAYEQALRATHGLFATSDKVQRGDFQSFVANLRIQNHPGLQGMGFALIVPPDERERHIATVRSQGFPAYTVQPPGANGTMLSAIPRCASAASGRSRMRKPWHLSVS